MPDKSRFRRPRQRVVAAVLVLTTFLLWRLAFDDRQPDTPEALAEGLYQVQRVVDGDTLLLTNRARIRLIGADTPETKKPGAPVEPWGPEATEYTKQFVSEGTVRLTFDRERKDRYGRFLAYVWVDRQMLNEELIRAGLATAELQYRYSQSTKNTFRKAEDEARAASRGIWSNARTWLPPMRRRFQSPKDGIGLIIAHFPQFSFPLSRNFPAGAGDYRP